ncbi:MAG: DEAD/DEAH box helicase [Holophagales bacterium]|nr:DEAD/DEAH box helicase [Holophagales bacterium]
MDSFSEPVRRWFDDSFPGPTRVQELGWPVLTRGGNALLVAPTGSGKTLAAFLWAIDRLSLGDEPDTPGVRVVYVSPLKALAYDIERNLQAPLEGVVGEARKLGAPVRPVSVDVRTGDTPPADRRRQLRKPGEILVTTPESLYPALGSRAAANLRTVETVIVDEVHAMAATKRGAHLALSLERLAELAEAQDPQRIGLSATVRPMDLATGFLGGDRPVEVVDASEPPNVDLQVVVPVPDMEAPPPAPESLSSGEGWPRSFETSGLWPSVFPRILEAVRRHRSTIVFVNSRSLCERLAQRLNELDDRTRADVEDDETDDREPLARAHHGSISHERRREIEGALKAGRLRCIVATSSLELGIDMGSVDLVLLVEAPGSTASGLQRVGRSGHAVGERSRGLIFPKFRGDLLECTVTAIQMQRGAIESMKLPENPLDVLAQQIVAMCCGREWTVDGILALARRARPYRGLTRNLLAAVLDMLVGRFPSEEFADLRPRLSWDRGRDVLTARRGADFLVRMNAGTIPDRGLFTVHLGPEGPRVGELDEEMVYESRAGDTFLLGASAWRVTDITRDRVIVRPAPGEPGRMPFWHGDGPGRPLELGRALGAFVRELGRRQGAAARRWLAREAPLDPHAVSNLCAYVEEQRDRTGALPTDRAVTLERFRDEIGDWRVCILTPFGARIHAPWAMALERRIGRRFGFEVQTLWTDDGLALRFADTDELPAAREFLLEPDEVEDLVVEQVASSPMFASRFRENAARALLLPRNRPGKRTPLWQQRQRSKNLLSVVRRYPDFPILLETYRECLSDLFDLSGLVDLMAQVADGTVRVDDVETLAPSPFARSLVFSYEERFLYDQDAPAAERRAQALTLDRELLRELLGTASLRELLDPDVIRAVEEEFQGLSPNRRARHEDDLYDLLRRTGGLTRAEIEARAPAEAGEWLADLERQKRAVEIELAGKAGVSPVAVTADWSAVRMWVAADDAVLYRDGLDAAMADGLPADLLEPRPEPIESLLRRYAQSRGPFTSADAAARFGLPQGAIEPLLTSLEEAGRLTRGEFRHESRDGAGGVEWCDAEVLRRIKRRTLARLRREAEPVDGAALARFLGRWQGVDTGTAVPTLPASRGRGRAAAPASSDRALVRLREAVAQLEGVPLSWRTLVGHVLPARVPGFRLDMLDRLAASGELLWLGDGRLGSRDGRIAIYRRERFQVLARGSEPIEASDEARAGTPHATVLDRLKARGACFTFDLVGGVAGDGDWGETEVEAAIWDLVWAGRVTNDTFLPLASLGKRRPAPGGRSPRGLPRGWRRGPRAGTAPAAMRAGVSGARRGRAGMLAGGRWSLVSDLAAPAGRLSDTEWAHATATLLLDRYGVVAAETARNENVPGGFEALYPVLREMEEAGHIRRGYFVHGLAGRQFALPAAVERLRRERRGPAKRGPIGILPAVDPANPWGAVLPWPRLGAEIDPRRRGPRRVPGAWVVLRAGSPCLFLEAGGQGVWTFAALGGDPEPRQAWDALRDLAGRRRRRTLRLLRIDGRPARESPWAATLDACGYEKDLDGYRVSRLLPAVQERSTGR